MKKAAHQPGPGRQRYLVAMVLGTALSALGASSAKALEAPETTRAVNAISRYCTVCWRNARLHPDSWTDCTQEVFSRLLERVTPETWSNVLRDESEERREFLRAIDTVKKRTQRARKASGSPVEAMADPRGDHDRELAEERQLVHEAAAKLLSPRQQQILQMSLEGWSVHDIAAELKISPARISDEKYKAVRKLRERFDPDVRAADHA